MALVMASAYTVPTLAAILAALANGWKIRLYKNNVTPDDTSDVSDFMEATFTGYAALTPTWTPGTDSFGNALITSDTLNYSFTAGSGSQLIYGYYITDPSQPGEPLVGAEIFGTSVTFTPGNPNLALVVTVTLKPEF